MGVMSRRVIPACGNLCFFCPSLRARSRQPVKRYKKLLSDIFPRNQGAEPNDRKIGKLCDYASKNPLRIPKITEYLEQKCYKDLRNENFGSVKVVLCIYRKLLSSCKDQMSLFASSLLAIIRALLDQTRQDEMQILSCDVLVEFIDRQMDNTYMFNLEGIIPKLCQLAQEMGDNDRALRLRSAGMQVLAKMVWFMGEHSHISMDFDNITSATLENYMDLPMNSEKALEDKQWVQGVTKEGEHGSSFPDMSKRISSIKNPATALGLISTMDTSKCPSHWSRVCLQNMADLAKESTTVRRVLEPLFNNFDAGNQWSLESGIACSVLVYLQSLIEESGENSHLLLSVLVKHLDNKNVAKQPLIQIEIIKVTTHLAHNAKQQASVALIGAISELMKHLRKCLQNSAEASSTRDCMYADLQSALEKCILQLADKLKECFNYQVGDVGPILDMMASVLENMPTNAIIARGAISAVHRTALIVPGIPNISYHKKAFPDALFHQLLLAMAHPDYETRVRAHSVFSAVLMPTLVSPDGKKREAECKPESVNGGVTEGISQISNVGIIELTTIPSQGQSHSFKRISIDEKMQLGSIRLSGHQISLLLSSIWVQATLPENTPANFEAMAHSYNIALLFTRSKASSHVALVRCFQLAFSLRSISLDQEGGLQPSCRRSLFTLASSMLIFSARAGNLPGLVPIFKASLKDKTVDPHLELVEDASLLAVSVESGKGQTSYGSPEDDFAALKYLSVMEPDDKQLREAVISHFMTKYGKLSEDELSDIKQQLLDGFSPDDAYPLGAPLFLETPRPCSPLAPMELQAFEEAMPLETDDETFTEVNGSQSDRRSTLSSLDILNVNELMESVLETAKQVASFPPTSAPISYDQMKSQCEALMSGKQQKMLALHSFNNHQEAMKIIDESETDDTALSVLKTEFADGDFNKEQIVPRDRLSMCAYEYNQNSFRLPPSSPYDKFLKAARC
ncbi:hypothetical protein ACFE04_007041 [Oxalis oulophora]